MTNFRMFVSIASAFFGSTLSFACAEVRDDVATTGEELSVTSEVQQGSQADDEYRTLPGGRRVHRSCVHEVPEGAVLDGYNIKSGKGIIKHVSACSKPEKREHRDGEAVPGSEDVPTVSGWVDYVHSMVPANAAGLRVPSNIQGTVTVPSRPSTSGGLIYMFNGFEDAAGTMIIQPVLQYGNGPIAAGNNWVIASWYGGAPWGGNYYHSTPISASPGDVVGGVRISV